MKSLFYMTKMPRKIFKYLKNEKSFWNKIKRWNKKHFSPFFCFNHPEQNWFSKLFVVGVNFLFQSTRAKVIFKAVKSISNNIQMFHHMTEEELIKNGRKQDRVKKTTGEAYF